MIGTLTKLGNITEAKSANPLRTASVRGSFLIEPKVGWPFQLANDQPLTGVGARVVVTSPVKQITSHNGQRIVFNTENSTYELIIDQ